MKMLNTSTPATGPFNPQLAIGRILIAADHEIAGFTGSDLAANGRRRRRCAKRSGPCSTNRITVRARRSWLKSSLGSIHDLKSSGSSRLHVKVGIWRGIDPL
jgi:hypothetical protein